MTLRYSDFASHLSVETAFTVLAAAKSLKAAGKDVIELEIGDSPFPTTPAAKQAGIAAIEAGQTRYAPSIGLPEFREAAAQQVREEYGLDVTADNIVAAPGAKIFQTLFCQLFLNQGDGVLVFSPYFPTYLPNIASRGARAVLSDLTQQNAFRPNLADVEQFLATDPRPKAIFLNSPHNPTGGVATRDDLRQIAEMVRGRNVAIFSDEPYNHMVWEGQHHTILAEPDMLAQTVAAYTFSKSYSMSGWRLGYAVTSPEHARMLGNLVNVSLSCVPPLVQLAGAAALREDKAERDRNMALFREKVELLATGLNQIEGIHCLTPGGAFYVFPNVKAICNRLGITSHGLAMYLLEAADDQLGVACLGGECFGGAGAGFLRFSCAEPNERLQQALAFFPEAFSRKDRVEAFLKQNPRFRLEGLYAETV
jgi:aspartate aminotransferase